MMKLKSRLIVLVLSLIYCGFLETIAIGQNQYVPGSYMCSVDDGIVSCLSTYRSLKNKFDKYSNTIQVSEGWFGAVGHVQYPIAQDFPSGFEGDFGLLELMPFTLFASKRVVSNEHVSCLMNLKLSESKQIDLGHVRGTFIVESKPSIQHVFLFSELANGRPIKMEINFLNFNGKAVHPVWACELEWKAVSGVMRQSKSTSHIYTPGGNVIEMQMEFDWIVGMEELKKKNVDKLLHRGYNFDTDTFDVGLPLDEAVFNLFEKE